MQPCHQVKRNDTQIVDQLLVSGCTKECIYKTGVNSYQHQDTGAVDTVVDMNSFAQGDEHDDTDENCQYADTHDSAHQNDKLCVVRFLISFRLKAENSS